MNSGIVFQLQNFQLRRVTKAFRSESRQCGSHRCRRAAVAARKCSTVTCSLTKRAEDVVEVLKRQPVTRDSIRLGLPSKGRMAEDTLELLADCQLKVRKPNPRQYVAEIPELPGVEVWFQRASDVVRKLRFQDLDLGIVGYDMFAEFAAEDDDLIVLHEALDFGQCKLALGVPMSGKFSDVNTLDDLRSMADWTADTPLRVVTGYQAVAKKYFQDNNFEHVVLVSADGALEAAPAMGSADIILDLVSTGVTLRENNLKQIEGGTVLRSEGVLIANKQSLLHNAGLLPVVKQLLERLDAHLTAGQFYSVIANMRVGNMTPDDIAAKLLSLDGLQGLQGPTIAPVYTRGENGAGIQHTYYAATICVPKKELYAAVKSLRQIGGSGVLVQPMTYIFNEESARWQQLLQKLGVDDPTRTVDN